MTNQIVIGDTPEQLNTKCANWVDVLVIDGKAYTAEQVKELLKERDALAAELSKLCEFRDEVVGVMNESSGIVGWHKNHTVATWDELFPVVPDFESPQQCLRDIQAEAGRKGYIAACLSWMGLKNAEGVNFPDADQYAATVRQGGAE